MFQNERSSNLYVKSFFAGSIPEAMDQARRELGVDALLLNSREAPLEARHLGEYEVVFGVWPTAPALAMPAPAAPAAPASPTLTLTTRLEFALVDAGIEPELARSIERGVRKRLSKGTVLDIARPHAASAAEPQSWIAALTAEIGDRFSVLPEIGRITALVGPPGAGKTTTLVKLAIALCLKAGRSVRLISADTLRIGAAEQLRTYAGILGVPFQTAENSTALAQAIESAPANTYLLIDTPGFSATLQQDLGGDLAQFLTHRQDIDTHLILTASMDRADLRCVVDRFQAFRPTKLLFTHLDETSTSATILSEAARTQKPLSFFCHGQSVPEDLKFAVKDHVIDSLVHQLPESLQAVA